jgi:predicted acyltransferase
MTPIEPAPVAARGGQRLISLDAFRGFAIASMVLVNNPGDWGHLYAPLDHAEWNGWTFTDTIFPFFLFIVGVSMSLSFAARAAAGASAASLLRGHAGRVAVIFLVGLALNLIPHVDFAHVRIPGVLQRIALCSLLAAPLVLWGRWRAQAAGVVVVFALYALLMLYIPVPDVQGQVAAGLLEPGRDFGAWLDRLLLPGHLWSHTRTWDPEGLTSTLPAVGTLLFGALAGRVLQMPWSPLRRSALLALAGALLLALGLVMDRLFMPINKNLWTPSFSVFMAGWALLAFAGFHALLDAPRWPGLQRVARRLSQPLVIYGMNALFIFALSGLVARLMALKLFDGGTQSLKQWLYAPLQALPLSAVNASLLWALLFNAAMFAVAWFMWTRRWFIKA